MAGDELHDCEKRSAHAGDIHCLIGKSVVSRRSHESKPILVGRRRERGRRREEERQEVKTKKGSVQVYAGIWEWRWREERERGRVERDED